MTIPVISLWRPWSDWVAIGQKRIETRLHDKFKSLVNQTIAIHATARFDKEAIEQALWYRAKEQLKYWDYKPGIICTVFVKEVRWLTGEDSSEALIDCNSVKRYGLVLEDAKPVRHVEIAGKQGIWYYSGELQNVL